LCFDISHAIAELNRASHCTGVNSDYFEVSALSTAMTFLAKDGA